MNKFKIHIFCLKKEICSLIKKKLGADGNEVECTNISDSEPDFLDNLEKSIDCIILDKDIDSALREKIKNRFAGIPIVCLPSLDDDTSDSKDITYISEPLKISELSETIREIRLKKEVEADN